jgi:hypothetical protein
MILALMFLLHFVADFILQSREMGKKKSVEFRWLLTHLEIQTIVFVIGLSYPLGIMLACKVAVCNSLIHGLIDWNIWKLYKLSAWRRIQNKLEVEAMHMDEAGSAMTFEIKQQREKEEIATWQYWEDHLFYTIIGFDQLLHGLTLIFLAKSFL